MANLIVPNKNKHKYIVGIDFGHGETSAAICNIEWGKEAGLREDQVQDIDLDRAARKKVITSAICHIKGGILIGDEAFEHLTDNNGIRICFKQKPLSLDGDAEKLMCEYMKAVYGRILENQEELSDDNHIVYIARPSGWDDEESKEIYRQMAIKAGIPLGGLTSESRAAIFYAKGPSVNFSKEISKGAIVFDLGSSTLDFTYLSDIDKPIDFGYNLGASIIDNAILENMILKDEVKAFLQKYPEYHDALLFKARKFKEDAYSRNEESKTIGGFPLGNIIPEEEESYDDYADTYVKLRIANLAELNNMISSSTNYMEEIKLALKDFKETKIPNKTVNGVFLTGGASRMNFIRPLISEALNISIEKVKIDSDNPSLTISRGIALLGATDATTFTLVTELENQLPSLINDEKMLSLLRKSLAENITNEAWEVVEGACSWWIKNGKTTDEKELKGIIQKKIEFFQANNVSSIINSTLQTVLEQSSEDIRKHINDIISLYAPGREISATESVQVGDIKEINESLSAMSSTIAQICNSITNVLRDILWAALGVFLWGLFCAPWYIYKALRSKESKRKDKANVIFKQKDKITNQIRSEIISNLQSNDSFNEAVTASLRDYFNKTMETNLQQVMIPIE